MPTRQKLNFILFHLLIFILFFAGSFIFIFFEQAHFDSDQAISGLMAKHLSEGRHFPVFTYGAKYVLGFETWLAAPFMWLWGASVATLKLPLLLLNLITVSLLIRLLQTEERLSWGWVFVSVIFFVFPSPITASRLIHAAIGVPTSFLAVLLVWYCWKNPLRLGLLLGFVTLIRPFFLFAVFALCTLEWMEHTLFTRENRRKWSIVLPTAAVVFVLIKIWGSHAPNYKGPSVPAFVIKDPITFFHSLRWLVSENLPTLFGLKSDTLLDFNITSALRVGNPLLAPLFGTFILIFLARSTFTHSKNLKHALLQHRFAAFLMLTGFFAAAVYTLFTRNAENIMLIRYTLLTIFFPIGFCAFYAKTEVNLKLRILFISIISLWFGQNMVDHSRLIHEYFTNTPKNQYRELVSDLQTYGIKYGKAPFWTAAHVTFFAQEQVKISETDFARIDEFVDEMKDHQNEIAQIQDGTCASGTAGRTVAKWCVLK